MLSLLPTLLVLLPALTAVSAAHKDRRSSSPHSSRLRRQVVDTVAGGKAVYPPPSTAPAKRAQTQWALKESIVGHGFLDAFTFDTFDDPTHGQVDYVDADTAASMNLTHATDTSFTLRADSFAVVGEGERGRKSVRLASKNTYTAGVVIMDLNHIPTGCGTWPAFWTVGPNWPSGGEIDIIEGVNNAVDNLSSLHTSDGCNMPDNGRQMLGTPTGLTCSSSPADNSGCATSYAPQPNSFGPGFNNNNGGAYAMSRTSEAIKIWFWPSGSAPAEIDGWATEVDENSWGTPSAVFPSSDQCQIGEKMTEHQMVINLTFCGDWAGGATYGEGGCPGTCSDHVRNNPDAFNDAFFSINSVRTYA